MKDITEEKKSMDALIESEKHAVKTTLAKTIAHEIKNPLTSITLSLELLNQQLISIQGTEEAI